LVKTQNSWSDEKVETMMGNLLRAGVLLAATVILLGGLIYLVRHGTAQPNYQIFRGEPADLKTLRGIWDDALSFRGRGIIQLGLLLLILTPVARVVFSVYAFARQQDWIYVTFTLIVLALLLYGLSNGASSSSG
jgi:uncharacterized membrane protein